MTSQKRVQQRQRTVPRGYEGRNQCKAKKVTTETTVDWKGIDEDVRSQLIDLQEQCEDNSWKARRQARKMRAALHRGICPDVPPIKAVVHKYCTSTRSIHVRVVPDTGATMTLIPWSMVQQLDLAMDEEDNQYDLYTANGEPMTILGSVILCIEPENSNTRELYALVTR